MKIIEDLKITRDQTLDLFGLDEAKLALSYGPGKWNVRELLHHIVDAETVLYDRIRRCISNPDQVVWGFDQEAWATELGYDAIPLDLSRSVYLSVRELVIYQADRFYESRGNNMVVHSNTGKRTLQDLFDKVVWHNQMHLDHIKMALG